MGESDLQNLAEFESQTISKPGKIQKLYILSKSSWDIYKFYYVSDHKFSINPKYYIQLHSLIIMQEN